MTADQRVDQTRSAFAPVMKSSPMKDVKKHADGRDQHAQLNQLFVDKYAPKSMEDIIGNRSLVIKLREWLKDWKLPVAAGPGSKKVVGGSGGFLAVLISGPPGIGKTTTAHMVGRTLGFDVLEFNASDVRSKNTLTDSISGAMQCKSIESLLKQNQSSDARARGNSNSGISIGSASGSLKSPSLERKTLLIMDEVDGMSSGDRGGSAELIKMIKDTKCPIICICNDRMNPKIRSLANHCLDLRFARPDPTDIAARVGEIAAKEGMTNSMSSEAIRSAVESSGCDLRSVINLLQSMKGAAKYNAPVGKDLQDIRRFLIKDQQTMQSPFDATKILLSTAQSRSLSFMDKLDMYFIDYDLMPLLMHHNSLRALDRIPPEQTAKAVSACFLSSNLISTSDNLLAKIRSDQDWSLLSSCGILNTVAPSFYCNNQIPFAEFPAHLGRISTLSKNARLVKELSTILFRRCSYRNARKSCLIEGIEARLVRPLMVASALAGQENRGDDVSALVSQSVQFLDALRAPKDVIITHIEELEIPGTNSVHKPSYDKVDSKIKALMTRTYNKSDHPISSAAVEFALTKGSSVNAAPLRGGSDVATSSKAEDDQDDEEADEGDDEPAEIVDGSTDQAKKSESTSSGAKTGSSAAFGNSLVRKVASAAGAPGGKKSATAAKRGAAGSPSKVPAKKSKK